MTSQELDNAIKECRKTIRETVFRLGITRAILYEWRRAGEIPAHYELAVRNLIESYRREDSMSVKEMITRIGGVAFVSNLLGVSRERIYTWIHVNTVSKEYKDIIQSLSKESYLKLLKGEGDGTSKGVSGNTPTDSNGE